MGIIKYVSFIIIYLISEISVSQEFQTIIQSGHSVSVNSLRFSKEGRYLFSHDKEGTVKTWDLKSGLLLSSIVCDATQGMVVISAAAGDSWAMEADEWKNGVFTYSILNGMKTMDADLNNDGEITVSELRDYVSESVQDLTNGLQKPTMRQENVEFDFRLW